MAPQNPDAEEKSPVEHNEAGQGRVVGLSIWQTVKKFKKAVLVCNLLCIAAAADGYQIKLHGNVIANEGFIQHFGFQNAQGRWYLEARYTAL